MFIKKEHLDFLKNYANFIVESKAVLSDDPKQRLVDYLSNEELLSELSKIFKNFKPGSINYLENINKEKYGILNNDKLVVRVEKKDNNTKYYVWIENEKTLYGDIDFSIAANILKSAMKGLGTDEKTVAGVAGVFIKLATDRNIDPKKYFEKLEEEFNKIGEGETLKEWIEGDFSGRAEVCALNAFQLPIESSSLRGFADNWINIFTDVSLGMLTLGSPYIFKGLYNLIRGGNVIKKSVKAANTASKLSNSSKLKAISDSFKALSIKDKVLGLEKAGFKVGSEFIAKSGRPYIVSSINKKDGMITLIEKQSNKKIKYSIEEFMRIVNAKDAINILKLVGLSIPAGLINSSVKGSIDSQNINNQLEFRGNTMEDIGEFLGYYDALTANPSSFINSLNVAAEELAQKLKDFKEGTGLFGNTTDQEELAIALIILNLNRETAKLVSEKYKKLTGSTIVNLIEDELEEDMAYFAEAYWYGLTGEGNESTITRITNLYTRIVNTPPARM